MSGSLFKFETVADSKKFCTSNERISCLDGSSNSLYLGTTTGHIVHVNIKNHADFVSLSMVQIPTKSVITQVIVASALDRIIVLSASVLFDLEMNSLKVRTASKNSNITCVAVNSDPVNENPFALQLALASANKQILVCEMVDEETTIKQKISSEHPVIAVCYSRHCICYATASAYFLRNLVHNVTHSLFPYEATTIRPIIVNIAAEEFLLNGMQGLAVFATSAGVSSRPPLIWGTDSVVSVAYHSPYIFVLTVSSLVIFRCDKAMEVQRFSVAGSGSVLSNVDGQIIFICEGRLNLLQEISWFQRAENLFAENQIEEALKLSEEALSDRPYEESEILKHIELKQRASIKYFFEAKFEQCFKLAVSSEMDPRELILCCDSLLPLPSGYQGSVDISHFKSTVVDIALPDYLRFLEKYLLSVRQEHWTDGYRKDIDTVLLKIMASQDSIFKEGTLPNLACSTEDCEEWLRTKGYFRFLASLAFHCGELQIAFDTCRKLESESGFDRDLFQLCIANLPRVTDENLRFQAFDLLVKYDASATISSLGKDTLECCPYRIVSLLESSRTNLIQYLEKIKHLEIPDFHTKLLMLYVDEISEGMTSKNGETDRNFLRPRLRSFIFESNFYDEGKVASKLRSLPHFAPELILLHAKRESDVSERLEELLKNHNDFDAAELLCRYCKGSNCRLYRTLLSFYIRAVKKRPEFISRITNLLNTMDAIDASEIIDELPSDWPLSRASVFLMRAISDVSYRGHSDRIKISALSQAVNHLSADVALSCQSKICIDDHTKCAACGLPIGNDDVCYLPQSTKLLHRACAKHNIS